MGDATETIVSRKIRRIIAQTGELDLRISKSENQVSIILVLDRPGVRLQALDFGLLT